MSKTRQEIKQNIIDNIHENNQQEITGQILQDVLVDMVDNLSVESEQLWENGNIGVGSIQPTNGDNVASSDYAIAEGYNTTASGLASHAEGNHTVAQNKSEHSQGQYNVSHKATNIFGSAGNTIHSVGIGTGSNDRKNAIEVMQNGDVYIKGIGYYDGTNANTPGIYRLQDALINPISGNTEVYLNPDIPFSSQVIEPNTTYVIQSNFDIDEFEVPEYCTLRFTINGSLTEGELILNHTILEGYVSLNNTKVSGSCDNEILEPQLFGAVALVEESEDYKDRNTIAFQSLADVINNRNTKSKVIHIPSGHYAVGGLISILCDCKIYGDGESSVIDLYDGGGLYLGSENGEYFRRCSLVPDCTITVNANKGDGSITLSDVSAFEDGDYIIITDTVDGSFCPERASYRTSELVRIQSVNPTTRTIDLCSTLYGNYKVNFESGQETTLPNAPNYRTAISRFFPNQFIISDFKIYSHSNSEETYEAWFSLLVCDHIGSEFRNIIIENEDWGNGTAAGIVMASDFIVENCQIRSSAGHVGDHYGLSISHCQNFNVNNCIFKSNGHALSTGGSNSIFGINNRNFIYEKLSFDTRAYNPKIDLDVHANSEYYKYLNIKAPGVMCDTGGYDVTVESCMLYMISTSFHQAGLTIRNCEITGPIGIGTLLSPLYDIDYSKYSIIIENTKINGELNLDLQAGGTYNSFIFRNNICNKFYVGNGSINNLIMEDNTFIDGNVQIMMRPLWVSIKNNILRSGKLYVYGNNVGARGIISGNNIGWNGIHEGADDYRAVSLSHFKGILSNNFISCELNKSLLLIYNQSDVIVEGNILQQGPVIIDSSICDVLNYSQITFDNNIHNSVRYNPIIAANSAGSDYSMAKIDKYDYYYGNANDLRAASVVRSIGHPVYARNVNKMGYTSIGKKGSYVLELIPSKNSPVVAQNSLTYGKTYFVQCRVDGGNAVYFSKTQQIDENDLLLAAMDNYGRSMIFTAPDPTVYPYIYVKTNTYSEVNFDFYENRGLSDYDGALFDVKRSGNSSNRPSGDSIYVGFRYFDTTLGYPIFAKTINNATYAVTWVDSAGNTINS